MTNKNTYCLAVIGAAARMGQFDEQQCLWQRLHEAPTPAAPFRLSRYEAGYARYGIPPIYRTAIQPVQLPLFELAEQALQQAEQAGCLDRDQTDVLYCVGFGSRLAEKNFERVLSRQLMQELRPDLKGDAGNAMITERLTAVCKDSKGSSHDKVGEMASTIPARIASHFRLKGRALSVEASDVSVIAGLRIAMDAIQAGKASSVLLLSAQMLDATALDDYLARHGYSTDADISLAACFQLCSGATALIIAAAAAPLPQALGYLTGLELDCAQQDMSLAPWLASRLQDHYSLLHLLENQSTAIAPAMAAALATDWPMLSVGSVQQSVGYSYANTLAFSVLACLTMLAHRNAPAHLLAGSQRDAAEVGQLKHDILLAGTSLNKQHFSLSLSREPRFWPLTCGQPVIPILAAGARFGSSSNTGQFWQMLTDKQGSIRDLSQFAPALYTTEPAEYDGFYCHKASWSSWGGFAMQSPIKGYQLTLPTDLIEAALQEAMHHLSLSEKSRVLVVTATNLHTVPERFYAFRKIWPALSEQAAELLAERPDGTELSGQQCLARWQAAMNADVDCRDFSASRLSSHLLQQLGSCGEVLAVEAACAGSLAAVDIAVDALSAGRVDYAVVAGVELPVNPHDLALCSAQRMLAPEQIAVFGEHASGFTPGDGAGVLVLAQPGYSASALGFIHGIGSCTDSKSVIAPNIAGQVCAMQRALAWAGINPDKVRYVETHGTGTRIGDEVEIQSLAQVYPRQAGHSLKLGALKSRFGHMFAAAGVASMIKTLLTFKYHVFPANLLDGAINPALCLSEVHFDPLQQACSWSESSTPCVAAINAFGTGGVNYHLILSTSPTKASQE